MRQRTRGEEEEENEENKKGERRRGGTGCPPSFSPRNYNRRLEHGSGHPDYDEVGAACQVVDTDRQRERPGLPLSAEEEPGHLTGGTVESYVYESGCGRGDRNLTGSAEGTRRNGQGCDRSGADGAVNR